METEEQDLQLALQQQGQEEEEQYLAAHWQQMLASDPAYQKWAEMYDAETRNQQEQEHGRHQHTHQV